MIRKEALKNLKNAYDSEHYPMSEFVSESELDVIKQDLDRLETMKIKTKLRGGMGGYFEDCYCPKCDMFICYEPQRKDYSKVMNYCYKCGQRLDWNEEVKE